MSQTVTTSDSDLPAPPPGSGPAASPGGACLPGASLTGSHLTGAHLAGAPLTGAPLADPPLTGAAALRLALMESRQRWRQFGALAVDFAFETDSFGQLSFVAPETVLGVSGESLLGQPARSLLVDPSGPDPFRPGCTMRRRPVWLGGAGNAAQCMALTTVPMLDEAGRPRGIRGIGVNVTEQERAGSAAASTLRRGEVLGHVLARVRQEVLAPRMMRAVLEGVMRALGSPGACVVDLARRTPPLVLHEMGSALPALHEPPMEPLLAELAGDVDATRTFGLPGGTNMLACTCSTRFGEHAALLIWRHPGTRSWDVDDLSLAGSVSGIVRLVLEHESIQRELARQARTDPLTGLMNRRAFLDEASRRLDRLERDGQPATLLFIDLDRLKEVNDRRGHEAGDSALILTAALLTRTFRPADLVARLGGDEFAVWLDGADSLTAAERAESLRLAAPAELAHLTPAGSQGMSMSIGIAMRRPGMDETLDQVMHRADQAMYEVKRSGRGHWLVSQSAPGR